jgi:hypothetical protein
MKTLIDLSTVQRDQLATACERSPDYFWQLANKWQDRKPSIELAKLIDEKSLELFGAEFHVSKESMRPDVWEIVTT